MLVCVGRLATQFDFSARHQVAEEGELGAHYKQKNESMHRAQLYTLSPTKKSQVEVHSLSPVQTDKNIYF